MLMPAHFAAGQWRGTVAARRLEDLQAQQTEAMGNGGAAADNEALDSDDLDTSMMYPCGAEDAFTNKACGPLGVLASRGEPPTCGLGLTLTLLCGAVPPAGMAGVQLAASVETGLPTLDTLEVVHKPSPLADVPIWV